MNNLDRDIKLYILSCIANDYDGVPTNEHLINLTHWRFEEEDGWRVAQVGQIKALTGWLRGLPTSIEYRSDKILRLAVSWGSLDENATEAKKDKILDNYWVIMANKLNQLFTGYRVPKMEIN